MSLYIQRWDGEWVDVSKERFLACCDCGLIHIEEYKIIDNCDGTRSILRRVFRDNRATAARRRSLKLKKEGIFAKKQNKKR